MRVSPQKARLVLDLIKGRRVEDALNTLAFTKKRVAGTVEKLVRSALENANYLSTEKGLDVDVDNLYVLRAVANDGPRMKRIRPAPMGRAYRYQRRMAHIEVALAERRRDRGCALRLDEARRRRHEDEAEEIGAFVRGEQHVFLARHSAELDPGHVTPSPRSLRTAAARSFCRNSDSPTRKA